ncbi:MAG TPA: hypothetical protein DHU55_11820 [Blastocatellia bacterium]|jgi:hypothetical protein|nr:hypothetical protein [Blastocatellia bacterium]
MKLEFLRKNRDLLSATGSSYSVSPLRLVNDLKIAGLNRVSLVNDLKMELHQITLRKLLSTT